MQDIQAQGVVVGDGQVEVGGIMRIAFLVFVFKIDTIAERIRFGVYLIRVFWSAALCEQKKQHKGNDKSFHD